MTLNLTKLDRVEAPFLPLLVTLAYAAAFYTGLTIGSFL